MTLTLNLNPSLQKRLSQEAQRSGLSSEQFTIKLLDRVLPLADQRAKAISLLQSWIDDKDDGEQQETGEFLLQALDEDRLSDRELFPETLKGVSW
jgi:hypothetical protein